MGCEQLALAGISGARLHQAVGRHDRLVPGTTSTMTHWSRRRAPGLTSDVLLVEAFAGSARRRPSHDSGAGRVGERGFSLCVTGHKGSESLIHSDYALETPTRTHVRRADVVAACGRNGTVRT